MKSFLITIQRWWLLFLLFVIPMSLRYLTKEPFAISWLNLVSVGFIGIGALNMITGIVPYRPIKHKPFIVLVASLLVAMAYALLFTHPLRDAIGLWTSRLLQPLLASFFAYQLFVNGYVKLNSIMRALLLSLVALILLGAMQLGGVIDYRNPGRITASYYQPNTFARYVEILLLVTFPWILFTLKQKRWWYLGLWLLGIVLLLSTKSYNGTVSFAIGLAAILIALPQPFSGIKKFGLVTLACLALLVTLNAPKLPKWQTSINDSRLTRLEFWHIAGKVLSDNNHWVTGVGIKTWEQEYPHYVEKYLTHAPLNWGSVQPHNVFLDSLLKAGLPGLFAVTALLIWPIVEGWSYVRTFRHKNISWWFGLSMLGYGTAMLIFGFIDDPLWSDDTVPLLFILYFILAALVSAHQPSKNE